MKLKERLENYWYHYKWTTIIVLFLLAVTIVCLVQLIQKEEYDACVMYVGDKTISETQYHDMVSSMDSLATDFTGDGKVIVNFSRLAYITDEKNPFYNEVNASAKEQMATMAVLPYYIYIMPAKVYLEYKDTGVFEQLSEIYGDNIPKSAYDNCAIYFNSTDFAENRAGGEGFSEDTIIALKVVPYGFNKSNAKKELAKYKNNLELFKNIVGN